MVLYKSYMPSVLIETGFLTNKQEGAYLNSSKGQKEIANEIAKGIITLTVIAYQMLVKIV